VVGTEEGGSVVGSDCPRNPYISFRRLHGGHLSRVAQQTDGE